MQAAALETLQETPFHLALTAAVEPTAMVRSDACKVANQNYRDFRHSWERLNNLVYALAFAATLFLIAGIVLVAVGSDTRGAGIVSFVGTVVTGVGARFVVNNRNQAKRELLAAARLVKSYCDQPASKLDAKDLEAVSG